MRQAVIVIGCNYGDEGKGLAAAWSARKMNPSCLNILINGGAQRGHTVDLPDGRRHVFHHFGSASFAGADSYVDEDFIVNPLLYVQEADELIRNFGLRPRLIVSEKCRVSTPYDMMLGQIIEENRGANRHGSCGCGIQETRLRYMNTSWALHWGELNQLSEMDFRNYCHSIIEKYIPSRLNEIKMEAGEKWLTLLHDEGILLAAWRDLQEMIGNTESCSDWIQLGSQYSALIFEAGQGLALDQDNAKDFPHLTPSHTTSMISAQRIAALPGNTQTEILYVTRSYLTRHGAGSLPTECPREIINPAIEDQTNIPNPHQQFLRYGFFDGQAVLSRVQSDREKTHTVLPEATAAILVTHLNETNGELCGNMPLLQFTSSFDRTYLSNCPWLTEHSPIAASSTNS